MTRFLLIFLIFTYGVNSYSQSTVYALTSHNDIIRINPSDCSYEVVIAGNQLNTNVEFTDIAYEQGNLYACSASHLYKVDLVHGYVNWINLGNGIDVRANGLTGDHNGNLYVSGLNLSKYSIVANTIQNLGELNFGTEGDLDFANGKIYIAARDSVENGQLLEVELTPFNVSVVNSIPTSIYGMTQHSSLNSDELFASKDSMLLLLDVNTGMTSIVCPDIFDGISIYGMTSGPDYLTASSIQEFERIIISQKNKEINIQVEPILVGQSSYYLYNTMGQIIAFSAITNDFTVIDMNGISDGILFLKVEIDDGSSYQRKIVAY